MVSGRKKFQASQAAQADDITTPNFQSQVNSLRICGPQVDAIIQAWSAQPYFINFEPKSLANNAQKLNEPFQSYCIKKGA